MSPAVPADEVCEHNQRIAFVLSKGNRAAIKRATDALDRDIYSVQEWTAGKLFAEGPGRDARMVLVRAGNEYLQKARDLRRSFIFGEDGIATGISEPSATVEPTSAAPTAPDEQTERLRVVLAACLDGSQQVGAVVVVDPKTGKRTYLGSLAAELLALLPEAA